jgi:hypothetical protein
MSCLFEVLALMYQVLAQSASLMLVQMLVQKRTCCEALVSYIKEWHVALGLAQICNLLPLQG